MRYQGAFALNATFRKCLVPKNNNRLAKTVEVKGDDKEHTKMTAETVPRNELIALLTSAQRLKSVFNTNLIVPLRGGTMPITTDIREPDIIKKRLEHIEAQPNPLKAATVIHF